MAQTLRPLSCLGKSGIHGYNRHRYMCKNMHSYMQTACKATSKRLQNVKRTCLDCQRVTTNPTHRCDRGLNAIRHQVDQNGKDDRSDSIECSSVLRTCCFSPPGVCQVKDQKSKRANVKQSSESQHFHTKHTSFFQSLSRLLANLT